MVYIEYGNNNISGEWIGLLLFRDLFWKYLTYEYYVYITILRLNMQSNYHDCL